MWLRVGGCIVFSCTKMWPRWASCCLWVIQHAGGWVMGGVEWLEQQQLKKVQTWNMSILDLQCKLQHTIRKCRQVYSPTFKICWWEVCFLLSVMDELTVSGCLKLCELILFFGHLGAEQQQTLTQYWSNTCLFAHPAGTLAFIWSHVPDHLMIQVQISHLFSLGFGLHHLLNEIFGSLAAKCSAMGTS